MRELPDPTARFTDRVAFYRRARPSYPARLITLLRDEAGLVPSHAVADIGSGTGLLSSLFLDNGNLVYGVEPNRAMRRAAEDEFAGRPDFRSVDGRAEATGLPEASVDFVVAAQAFHWFDRSAARSEFARILRSPGRVVLVWNTRRTRGTPFLQAYESFLAEWGTDYAEVRRSYAFREALDPFFGSGGCSYYRMENSQELDRDGLRDRLLSASYLPAPGHRRHQDMVTAIATLFDAHQRGGRVRLVHDTEVFCGTLQ